MNKDLNSTLVHAEQYQNRQYKNTALSDGDTILDVQHCTEQPYGKRLWPLTVA